MIWFTKSSVPIVFCTKALFVGNLDVDFNAMQYDAYLLLMIKGSITVGGT